ncbi:expressed unknown protein [Seminavis robusta]|uniref:Glycosyltransferase 61 catalytic domain-containing protein n=1 Tax=Seminavis robusta TaxID=568900 RepID=A0A9N8ESJ2_9STRA|nr:expressed unknown protein [Seminavis robusta]|eukprot:Sro1832_g300440.1 n/a (553) ;mRNA; f:11978-13774
MESSENDSIEIRFKGKEMKPPRKNSALWCAILALLMLNLLLKVNCVFGPPDANLQGCTTNPVDHAIASMESTNADVNDSTSNGAHTHIPVPAHVLVASKIGFPEFPPAAIPPIGAGNEAKFHGLGQFPSDMKQVEKIFAAMESNKTTHLEPTMESFLKHVTREAIENHIKGELDLQAKFPQYFMDLPAWEKDWGGVAVFSNAFIVGEPPVIFDGNIAFETRSCCLIMDRDWDGAMYKLIEKTARNEDRKQRKRKNNRQAAGIVILPSEQQYNVLLNECLGHAHWHAYIEELPRLVYVRDFIAKNKNITDIWARQGSIALDRRPEAFWNPSFFQSTTLPRWREQSKSEAVFARRLLVPTGSLKSSRNPSSVTRSLVQDYIGNHPQMQLRHLQASLKEPRKPVILYHHREPGKQRSLYNAQDLGEALRRSFSHCCVVKDFYHNATTRDTAVLHNEASIVVGPHGAGFANLLFSDPHKLIGAIELHPKIYLADKEPHVQDCNQEVASHLSIPFKQLMAEDGNAFVPFTANIPETVAAVSELLMSGRVAGVALDSR